MRISKERFREIWKKTFPTGELAYADAIYENIETCRLILIDEKELREFCDMDYNSSCSLYTSRRFGKDCPLRKEILEGKKDD